MQYWTGIPRYTRDRNQITWLWVFPGILNFALWDTPHILPEKILFNSLKNICTNFCPFYSLSWLAHIVVKFPLSLNHCRYTILPIKFAHPTSEPNSTKYSKVKGMGQNFKPPPQRSQQESRYTFLLHCYYYIILSCSHTGPGSVSKTPEVNNSVRSITQSYAASALMSPQYTLLLVRCCR